MTGQRVRQHPQYCRPGRYHRGINPYEPLAERAWSLRETVSTYDAWYVALAETLNSDMVTLDGRLAGAPGPMCTFITPY